MGPTGEIESDGLGARIEALPGVSSLRDAARAAGVGAYLVGGAVRDALLGAQRADLDVVVEGDPAPLLAALGGEARSHDRFGTASVRTSGGAIDVARARSESYPHPGALPEVRPAGLDDDLARRDFTINAMAVALGEPSRLIDPQGGLPDLRAGLLRALHADSFVDDPTRALRAARYAARLRLVVEEATLAALRRTDLTSVSADRVQAELRRLAGEGGPRRGFELLEAWGLMTLPPGAGELIDELGRLLAAEPWRQIATPAEAILAAVGGNAETARELARIEPQTASAAVRAARGHSGADLALARAMGAGWLDRYVSQWREVRPSISGDDLLAAGVPQGPGVGRGLEAALEAKLDGLASTPEQELEIALAASRPEA